MQQQDEISDGSAAASVATPLARIHALLREPQRFLHEILAEVLQVLQFLAMGQVAQVDADDAVERLLRAAIICDAAVLDRLLEDPRTLGLSPGPRRALDCLRQLRAGQLAAAEASLPTLMAAHACGTELMLAARLLLRAGRVADAIAVLKRAAADPVQQDAEAILNLLTALLIRRARPGEADTVGPPSELTVCTAVRDEAPDLEEWVAYHSMIGVERFRIYENGSVDGTAELLELLAHRYPIDIVPWPHQPANLTAFQDGLVAEMARSTWLACLDADEFLVPAEGNDLRTLLRRVPAEAAALVLNWRVFGSSGRKHRSGEPTLAAYRRRAADDFGPNRHIKSILRPRSAILAMTTHEFLTVGPQVNARLEPVSPLAGQLVPPCFDGAWINHYLLRSRDDFLRKRARGRPEQGGRRDFDKGFFEAHDRNEVRDRSVERFLPGLRERLAQA